MHRLKRWHSCRKRRRNSSLLYRKRPVYIYSAIQTCILSPPLSLPPPLSSPTIAIGNSSLFLSRLKEGVRYILDRRQMRRKSREKTCECVSYQKEVYWTFVLRKRDEMENYECNCRWIACKNFIAPFYFVRTRIIYPWIVLPNFQINHNTIDRANKTYLLARRGCIYTSNVSYFISKIQNLFQQREREIYIYIFKEVWKEVHFSTLEIRIFVYTFILEVFFVINAVARESCKMKYVATKLRRPLKLLYSRDHNL